MKKIITFNWERFPALFLFASLVSGGLLSLGIISPLLLAFTHKKRSFILGYLLLSVVTALLFIQDVEPTLDQKHSSITAYLKPIRIKKSGKRFFLQADLLYLQTAEQEEYKRVHAHIPISKKKHPAMNSNYLAKGKLTKSEYGYFFTPSSWKKVPGTGSFVETRFALHQKARAIISKYTKDRDVKHYFEALVTGCISDSFLRERFLSAGLLHCLAISGFHFSWIVFLLSVPLGVLFPKKIALYLLLSLALCYFFFIGTSFSISRSFVGISVYLLSILLSRVPIPLNALGVAGIFSIIVNPYSMFSLSFALSFLATFAVLTFVPRLSPIVNTLCPRRNKESLSRMPFVERTIYTLLRGGLLSFFLSGGVSIFLFPLFLLSFPFFSMWGLFYNIFFPFTMIPTLILLFLSFALHPFVSTSFLWSLNELFSKQFLFMVLYGKGSLALLLKLIPLSPHLLTLFGVAMVIFGLVLEKISHEEYLLYLDENVLT